MDVTSRRCRRDRIAKTIVEIGIVSILGVRNSHKAPRVFVSHMAAGADVRFRGAIRERGTNTSVLRKSGSWERTESRCFDLPVLRFSFWPVSIVMGEASVAVTKAAQNRQ